MEKIHYIYGLYSTRKLNPDGTPKVKYVGRATNPNSRLKQHLQSVGKIDNILYHWIEKEISKGFHIQMVVLDECLGGNIVELEKEWIEKIGKVRNLLNITSNGINSPSSLYLEIKKLKMIIYKQKTLLNELTGVKETTGLMEKIHLLDTLKESNNALRGKVNQLESYIKDDLGKPLPYPKSRT